MKNILNYLDDYMSDDFTFESSKKIIKKDNFTDDYIKTNRKLSREEEIRTHGKSINHSNVFKNKKTYTRKDKHKNNYK